MSKGYGSKLLGELCDILDRKRKPITKRDRVPGEFPYYGATGILDYVESYIFDENLVLIGEDGAKWGSGENTAFTADGKYWVNNHAHVIRPHRDKILDGWIVYYLNHADLSPFVTGLTVPKLNQAKLREIPIPKPPIAEQKRIVAILDEAFEGIDSAIANTEKNLANARELFESYLNAIFTRKGDGWKEKKLLDVCQRITVGHVGSMKSEYLEGGVPFLRSQNILPFAVNLEKIVFISKDFHDFLKKSKLKPGDVAIVRTGYPGTAAVIPESLPDSNCSDLVIVTPGSEVNPHYLCLFFNSAFGKNMVSGNLVGAAQKHFNVTAAKNVALPCPPVSQQEQLVSMCDDFSAATQRLEAIYQQKLVALNELKQSILQKAFSGELTSDTTAQASNIVQEVAAA